MGIASQVDYLSVLGVLPDRSNGVLHARHRFNGGTVLDDLRHSVRDLRVAEVVRQDVVIENGQVSGFRVRLGISFKYESGD